MIFTLANYRRHTIGPKARNLFLLQEQGYPVPPFFCISKHVSEEIILDYAERHFPHARSFSVRSCACVEDGGAHSFAGQFRTFLRVKREDLFACVRAITEEGQAREYARLHRLNPASIEIQAIIQEMVEADRSGVLFTANPQGILNESVIVVGRGTGDQIVEDRTDTTSYYYHLTDQNYYYEQAGDAPLLSDAQVQELIRIAQKIKEFFRTECDLEYAYQNGRLWLLQVRPITTLQEGTPVIILDNSNIVESYPGLTLPLTQSFIRRAYAQVFRMLLLRLTGERETVKRMEPVLSHMVDVANGRVYYRISNWYDILFFLPFYKKIIPLWQEMMGVSDKAVSAPSAERIGPVTRLRTARSFVRLLLTCPREMDALEDYFLKIQKRFRRLSIDSMDNRALLKAYHTLQQMTVRRWDLTLVNDMYAFLFTGLLKACLKARHVSDYALAANRAIRGIDRLDSMEPIRELNHLAEQARREGRLAALGRLHTPEDFARYLEETNDDFTRELQAYIQRFGDRNVEELKLESPTFRTDPILLIRRILQYADAPAALNSRESRIAGDASLRLRGLSRFFAKRAALGIRNRERSRLNRSRLYGMMRALVLRMGENLQREGRIARREDIFWLYCGELEQDVRKPLGDLKERIALRKEQYEGFRALPAYSRLIFSGKVMDKQPRNIQRTKIRRNAAVWTGIPCSQGIAEGPVLVIRDPARITDTKEKILVTRMTDPGWVFLIAQAEGIVAEKGSLLSHTAIIARELKKPAVVGIPEIVEELKDGDYVRVDGDTGKVSILRRAKGNS